MYVYNLNGMHILNVIRYHTVLLYISVLPR